LELLCYAFLRHQPLSHLVVFLDGRQRLLCRFFQIGILAIRDFLLERSDGLIMSVQLTFVLEVHCELPEKLLSIRSV
jgi:hypothetical protein